MLNELDRVALTVDIPKYGLRAGDTGTIVIVSSLPQGYIVEFTTMNGDLIGLVDLFPHQVRALEGNDVKGVRPLVAV